MKKRNFLLEINLLNEIYFLSSQAIQ